MSRSKVGAVSSMLKKESCATVVFFAVSSTLIDVVDVGCGVSTMLKKMS